MKMTKRIAAIAACAVMAATSMVSVCASATDTTSNDNYIVSEFEQNDNGIMSYAAASQKTLNITMTNQETENWCWAASAQAVLKYFGVTKTQSEVVKAAKGTVVDESGTTADIKKALNTLLNTTYFANYTGTSNNSSGKNYESISRKIGLGRPVILSGYYTIGNESSGHSMVCYGYDSSDSNNLKLFVHSSSLNGVDEIVLTCSSTTDTTYNMDVTKSDGSTESGSYRVTGITYNTREIN